MKLSKLLKAVGMTAIIGACLLPTACEVNVTKQGDTTIIQGYGEGYTKKEDGTVVSNESQVDFTNYVTFTNEKDYSIKVRNETQEKLIAFKGEAAEENLISGIPASATNFGLKNVKTMFGTTSNDFILVLVTEKDYLENKNNPADLKSAVFTKLYAFYNTDPANNKTVYKISRYNGGACSITVNNGNCKYNVELRRDGVNGETIGYAAYQSVNNVFKVNPGRYNIFPVFRQYDSALGEIVTVIPTTKSGKSVYETFTLDANSEKGSKAVISSEEWFENVTFSPSASYIKIFNNGRKGVCLYDSATGSPLISVNGIDMVNGGESRIYQINMDIEKGSIDNSPEFSEYKALTQLSVANDVESRKIYLINNSTTIPSEPFKFYANKLYTVQIDYDDGFVIKDGWKDNSTDVNFSGTK